MISEGMEEPSMSLPTTGLADTLTENQVFQVQQ